MAGNRRLILLTPPGAGGVMVLALRGPERWHRAAELLKTCGGAPLGSHGPWPRLAALCVAGRELDEVLVVDRPELSQLEVHAHGSLAVLRALEAAVGRCCRERPSPAQELLWHARGPEQLGLAMEQLAHPLEQLLGGLEGPGRVAALEAAWARSRVALALANSTRLVLVGAQNAGKSTLMNRLLHRERVLTGSLPGLTRDPVRETTLLAGYPYLLVDTAGEGPVADAVDRAAQVRGRRERRRGMRLLVVDGNVGPDAATSQLMGPDALVVRNKTDLPPAPVDWPKDLAPRVELTCRDPEAAAAIRQQVGVALRRMRQLPPAGPVGGPAALSEAQRVALESALAAARRRHALQMPDDTGPAAPLR